MFSLILVIIGIVLVAVIVIATIFYGGNATTQGGASAEAATLLAQSAQIATASAAYTAEKAGTKPQSLQDLVTGNYLRSVPQGWQDPTSSDTPITSKVIESQNACQLFNERQGMTDSSEPDGVPQCDNVTSLTKPVCCK